MKIYEQLAPIWGDLLAHDQLAPFLQNLKDRMAEPNPRPIELDTPVDDMVFDDVDAEDPDDSDDGRGGDPSPFNALLQAIYHFALRENNAESQVEHYLLRDVTKFHVVEVLNAATDLPTYNGTLHEFLTQRFGA